MNELHLFSGAGGGILGGLLLGHTPVCAVEIEPYCRKVLLQRQRDGILPWFPIWDDVRTFDGRPWRGIADIVCGGFPCQPFSRAAHDRNVVGKNLFHELIRVCEEVQPSLVFVENVPESGLCGINMSASYVGAPHLRTRSWAIAYTDKNSESILQEYAETSFMPQTCEAVWEIDPRGFRVDDGMANRMERIAAIGNGQVPAVAAKAWHVLCQRAAAGTLRKRPAQHTTAAAQNTA